MGTEVGIVFVLFVIILLIVLNARLTAPKKDYSGAVTQKRQESAEEISPFWTEYIARQDEDFRAGR